MSKWLKKKVQVVLCVDKAKNMYFSISPGLKYYFKIRLSCQNTKYYHLFYIKQLQ